MPENNTTASAFAFTVDLRRPGFVAGGEAVIEALVRLQAPARPAGTQPREPLTLALVIDRSGSMAGAPLHEAKQCARGIVQSLGPHDRAALVTFDDEVELLSPVVGTGQRASLLAAIDGIQSGGATNLHGGWLEGARTLGTNMTKAGVHRMILLSDGCANRGDTDLEAMSMSCRDASRNGISTSTYGLGRAFNEDLMLAMSRAGRGNAYYGQTAQDLAEPFQAEFALLTSLCARGMALKVNAPAGVQVRLRNDYEPADGEGHAWKLPDLAFDAEAWAYLELTVPAVLLDDDSVNLPVTFSIKAAGAGSTPLFFMASLPPVKRMSAQELAALPAQELIERRRDELDAGDALDLARKLIADGQWDAALAAVEAAQQRFAGNPWCAGILETMRRMVARRDAFMSKEAAYASRSLRNRLASRDEIAFSLDAVSEDNVPAFLRRKPEQGKGRPREE